MSRRPPAFPILAVLSLVAAGLLVPLASTALAAGPYGAHVFQANPYVPADAQSYPVYAASTVAQSFTVSQTYLLDNVTLRVVNNGSSVNALVVSIHPDDPTTHLPVMGTVLASWSEVTPNNDPTPVNASWTFGPPPLLLAGTTYWIVAENNAPQALNGYQCFSTNGDTYGGGHALLFSGGAWSGLPYDLYFVTFGQEYDANLTPVVTASAAQADPGDFVSFTVDFNNTGASTSGRVWVNDTLRGGLTNTSLSFPGIKPDTGAVFPNLTFTNVGNGPHSFTVTAQVAIGTPPGTWLTNTVSLAYTNQTGAVVQAGTSHVETRAGLATKQLYLANAGSPTWVLTTTRPTSGTPQTTSIAAGGAPVSFALSPALARPLHALNVSATLWLSSVKAPTQTYHLTIALLDNGTPVASLAPSFQITLPGAHAFVFNFALSNTTFGAGHVIGLQITNLGGGGGSTDALVVSYNSTGNDSRLEILTDTYVSLAPLALANQMGPMSTWSTLDSLVVQANVSDPFGASRIHGVWVNITSPDLHLAAAGAMSLLASDPSALPAWRLFGFTLSPPLSVGRYRVEVKAMEDNGVVSLAEAWADVAVPAFNLETTPSTGHAETAEPITFSIAYNNTGTGDAGWVWLNDTLPAGLAYASSSVSPSSVSGSTYTWAFTNVAPGPHRLDLNVTVSSGVVGWTEDQAVLDFKDESGHSFAPVFSNASVFLNGPDIALSMTLAPSAAVHANQTVSYTFTLANSGAAAYRVWVNDTLPSGFTYLSSNADQVGGVVSVAGTDVGLTFTDLPANTTWQFEIEARSGAALLRNASYANMATLVYASLGGVLMPPATVTGSLVAFSPWFPYASVRFPNAQVVAGTASPATISFTNEGNEAASRAWINLTLDSRLTITNASLPYTTSTNAVLFALANVAPGGHTIFLNLTVSIAAADRAALSVVGSLDSQDAIGNSLPITTLASATVFVHTVQINLYVTPTSPRFEAGVPYPMTIALYNWGTDTAANVWLNVTLPSALQYVNDSSGTAPIVGGTVYSWHWTNMSQSSLAFDLYLEARPTTPSGTGAPIYFNLQYQGSNLMLLPGVTQSVNGVVIAPVLDLTASATADSLVSGGSGTLVYTLQLTNAGLATARDVYITDAVDTRLQVVTYDSSVGAVATNGTYNWTFAALEPGETEVVNLTVRAAGGIAAGSLVPNVFEAAYTNSRGEVLGRMRSEPFTITVTTDYTGLAAIGLGAAAVAIAAVAVLRRRKVDIEEVFLVYRDGVLISHLSRTLMREKDEDVLSGMLTAVQEFVREAFQYGEHRDLHQLDFGDYRILIERGKYVFLAVVYSGKESISIHKKVRSVIERIEHEFGTVLENWDGDMEEVVGARDLIRDTLLGSSNHNHTPKAVAESE